MKKLLLVLLAVVTTIGTLIAAPQPKMKKLKLADAAVYNGLVLQKLPQGEGSITMVTCGNITGTFNGNEITNGKIEFENHKFVITGDMTYSVAKNGVGASGYTDLAANLSYFAYYKCLLVTVKNAKINNRRLLGDVRLVYCCGDYALDYHSVGYPKVSKELLEEIKMFVGEEKFKRTSNGKIYNLVVNKKVSRKVVEKATNMTLTFNNGAVAVFDIKKDVCKMTRTNGDFITINGGAVESYRISAGKSVIANGQITHTFENGNKYVGTVGEELEPYTKETNVNALLSFNGLNWAWADFKKYAGDGKIVYADGKTEKIIGGISEAEYLAQEAKLKAVRVNDKVAYAADGEIASCIITYLDGTVFKFVKKGGEVATSEYVYKNGDKMGACFESDLTKEIYNKLIADAEAPKISDWNYRASYRHFANGYKITDYDKYLTTPKQKNGDYISYVLEDNQFVPNCWQKTINGDVYVSTVISTPNGECRGVCYVKYANQKFYLGLDEDFEQFYQENFNNSVAKNASIVALGVKVVCGLEDIKSVSFGTGLLCGKDSEGNDTVEVLYYEGAKFTYQQAIQRGMSDSEITQALRNAKLLHVYNKLATKYASDKYYVDSFFSNEGLVKGTPIEFVRDLTAYFAASKYSAFKKVESVQGDVRKLTIVEGFCYGGQVRWGVSDNVIGVFEFDAKDGYLISFELDSNADIWSHWLYEYGLVDAFKLRNLL